MNKLTADKRAAVVSALVEGNSIRATVRMTGVAKNTVVKLLADLGSACRNYHNETVRNLKCKKLQADEIWSFCYARDKNVPDSMRGQFGVGDVWTWTSLCADTKLIVSYLVGNRDTDSATDFMHDLADRLANRVQLTTDGYRCYLLAVPSAFGNDIDYAILNKVYGVNTKTRSAKSNSTSSQCVACMKIGKIGTPIGAYVSTSFVERQNLTMRMGMRRFTRMTNAFSKKVENLEHVVALHFMHYNFCRKHQTLGTTPAVAAGIADHQWTISDLVKLLDGGSN